MVVAGLLITAATAGWMLVALGDEPAFLTLWLPASLPLGIGWGAIATGVSAAAALSVGPARFAAGMGLNQAARAVGGSLGVAAMATILNGTDPTAAASYDGVFVLCIILLAAAAAVACGLTAKGAQAMIRDIDVLAREWADPHVAADHELARMMRPPVRWQGVVVLGDSVAEGVRSRAPGYRDLSWADRLRAAFALARPGATLFNLGRRDLLAAEIRETQLAPALALRPGLAHRDCGRQRRAAAALRRQGAGQASCAR